MSMMAASLRSRAATVWKRHAMLLGSGVTGVKTCVADLLVQMQYEQREEIDWSRTFVVCTRHQTLMAPDHCPDVPPFDILPARQFSSFGLLYLGAFQYVQYSMWFPRLFPGAGFSVVAKRVAFDQIVNTGCWYYPLFYVVQSCVMHARFDLPTATEGFERCKMNWTTDMVNCWKL